MGCEEVSDRGSEEGDGEGEETKEEFDEGVCDRRVDQAYEGDKSERGMARVFEQRDELVVQIEKGDGSTRLTIQQLPPTPSIPPRNQPSHSSRTREERFSCDPNVD